MIDWATRCQLTEPPPPIRVTGENRRWAGMVRRDLDSRSGEYALAGLAACGRGLFRMQEEPRETLGAIAACDFRHLMLLEEALAELTAGRRVRFRPPRPAGGTDDPDALLCRLIAGKRQAIARYRRQLGRMEDRGMRALLDYLLREETRHLDRLERLRRTYGGGG